MRSDYETLAKRLGDYYQVINVDFRNGLKDKKLPNIYVYQGDEKYRHIIACDMLLCGNGEGTIIYPFYGLTSNREFRHFYNKTSFKYLEGLSKDYDYGITGKILGKIRIKKL